MNNHVEGVEQNRLRLGPMVLEHVERDASILV